MNQSRYPAVATRTPLTPLTYQTSTYIFMYQLASRKSTIRHHNIDLLVNQKTSQEQGFSTHSIICHRWSTLCTSLYPGIFRGANDGGGGGNRTRVRSHPKGSRYKLSLRFLSLARRLREDRIRSASLSKASHAAARGGCGGIGRYLTPLVPAAVSRGR